MKSCNYLLLPFWILGKLYSVAAKEPFMIRLLLLGPYAFPAIKLCDIAGVSMAWPVLWIPLICIIITNIIDAEILRADDSGIKNGG